MEVTQTPRSPSCKAVFATSSAMATLSLQSKKTVPSSRGATQAMEATQTP